MFWIRFGRSFQVRDAFDDIFGDRGRIDISFTSSGSVPSMSFQQVTDEHLTGDFDVVPRLEYVNTIVCQMETLFLDEVASALRFSGDMAIELLNESRGYSWIGARYAIVIDHTADQHVVSLEGARVQVAFMCGVLKPK